MLKLLLFKKPATLIVQNFFELFLLSSTVMFYSDLMVRIQMFISLDASVKPIFLSSIFYTSFSIGPDVSNIIVLKIV